MVFFNKFIFHKNIEYCIYYFQNRGIYVYGDCTSDGTRIHAIKESDNFRTQTIKMPHKLLQDLEIGASVANNGVCLTVTKIEVI